MNKFTFKSLLKWLNDPETPWLFCWVSRKGQSSGGLLGSCTPWARWMLSASHTSFCLRLDIYPYSQLRKPDLGNQVCCPRLYSQEGTEPRTRNEVLLCLIPLTGRKGQILFFPPDLWHNILEVTSNSTWGINGGESSGQGMEIPARSNDHCLILEEFDIC